MTKVKKKDLRKRLAQVPINYPAPEPIAYDFAREKDRVENLSKRLADNEVVVRDQCLEDLKIYLAEIHDTHDLDDTFAVLWKGMFYCFWHSDKPLVQLECAQTIANLQDAITERKVINVWIRQGWLCLAREWGGIDKWRMDKFMALVRRILNKNLRYVKGTTEKSRGMFCDMLLHEVLLGSSIGLGMHTLDIFLDEMLKVDVGKDMAIELLKALPLYAMSQGNFVENRVMQNLIRPLAAGVLGTRKEFAKYNTPEFLRRIVGLLKLFSVEKSTKFEVRPVFKEAQQLVEEAAEQLEDPEEFEPLTYGEKASRRMHQVRREMEQELKKKPRRDITPRRAPGKRARSGDRAAAGPVAPEQRRKPMRQRKMNKRVV